MTTRDLVNVLAERDRLASLLADTSALVRQVQQERDALRAAVVALIEARKLRLSANPADWERGKQDESATMAKLVELCGEGGA